LDAERAIVSFWASYWGIWHRAFPRLHKRAQWHIVTHLCTRAQNGAALGEIFGMIRQVLLLEDATVRERVTELVEDQWCMVDPPTLSAMGRALSARTILAPTPALLAQFDATLLALLGEMAALVPVLDPCLVAAAPPQLDPSLRASALAAVEVGTTLWAALLEKMFTARALSAARRVEARRNLLSTSHRMLMITAIQDHYGLLVPTDPEGLMADRMSAIMLELTGQNFQTTRDHIAYLLQLGVLDRRPGRTLRVALSHSAADLVRETLHEAAAQLSPILSRVAAPDPHAHRLQILAPGLPPRIVVITEWPFTIGRVPGNHLELASTDISRQHCRLELMQPGPGPAIADLGSTNGTVVNDIKITTPTPLTDGASIRLGKHELKYLAPAPVRPLDDVTVTAQSTVRR
jgi:hypothetical protein